MPALEHLHAALKVKDEAFAHIIKIGRTHTQDATPLTLGQEFGGYSHQVAMAVRRLKDTLYGLYELAQGGTAVGTGLNAPIGFAEKVAERIAAISPPALHHRPQQVRGARRPRRHGVQPRGHNRRRPERSSRSPTTCGSWAADPARALANWPCPENEPGSSIMPGKVNPPRRKP
jgi:fumarate hydratase class II